MKNELQITFFSDSHTLHDEITKDLIGGDVIVCAGDVCGPGHEFEVEEFLEWYHLLKGYQYKIFVAGNHDRFIEQYPKKFKDMLKKYPSVIYLQDESIDIEGWKFYGSPWQPEFCNWAFNLPRHGEELKARWNVIPDDVDILITHGPPFGKLDKSGGLPVGCEILRGQLETRIAPIVHCFGHIHTPGISDYLSGKTTFVNATVVNEGYRYVYPPQHLKINKNTREIY